MTTAVLIKMDPRDPDLSRIREIARGTREGKLVAFPTETVYGVGGPMSAEGIQDKLTALKGRSSDKPFSFHIGDWEMLDFLGVVRTPAFRYLSRKFWPGPLTILTFTEDGKKIGLRFPSNRLAMTLINATGEPFVATSANVSGKTSPHTAQDVENALGKKIDYILDGGKTELKVDSTIVDLTGDEPVIVRPGAAAKEVEAAIAEIKKGKFARKRVLIVCTGNSCRSPMALGWMKAELKKKDLENEIEVDSCGIGCHDGMAATPEAVFVMKNREIDITEHRSRACTREDIIEADAVIAMDKNHYTFITSMVPSAKNKTRVFNIMDPIGSSLKVYEKVMDEIEQKLEDCWDWVVA